MSRHPRAVLTIGDSNGAAPDGWPAWLKEMLRPDIFINNSLSGRTLGFDNPDSASNALTNIDSILNAAVAAAGQGLDDVVVALGTNDCKACFASRLGEVEGNLRKMVEKIRKHDNGGRWSPRVVLVAPPPYGPDEKLLEKYHGGATRAKALSAGYERVARDLYTRFVNAHSLLEPIWGRVSADGIHMNTEGQQLLARAIADVMQSTKR